MRRCYQSIIIVILTSIIYVIMYWVLRNVLQVIPDLYVWNNFELLLDIQRIELAFIDFVYFILGFIFINHGAVNLINIIEENHAAQDMKIRKPKELLTTGSYAKARHPMYGTFIIINLGVFFSTRSLWGIVIVFTVLVIQMLNSIIEEKTVLRKTFGKDYEQYKKKTKNRFFTPIFTTYIIISVCLTILGLIANV